MIGKTVPHHTILEEIGRGGMGVVYRAEDTRVKRTVALKFLPPGLVSHPEAKERFVQDARAAASVLVQHQHHEGLGENGKALDRLEKVLEDYEPYLIVIGMHADPTSESITDHPRFKALVERIRVRGYRI